MLSKLNAEVLSDTQIQRVKDRLRQKREAEEWREAQMDVEVSVKGINKKNAKLNALLNFYFTH